MPDVLTTREEKFRDRILQPLVDAVVPYRVRPNHVTVLRLILIFLSMVMRLLGFSLLSQLEVVVLAALTDGIDGVMARTRNQITKLGGFLDHVADWLVGAWLGCLALFYRVLEGRIIALMVIPQVLLGVINWWAAMKVKGMKRRPSPKFILHSFGLEHFEPTVFLRLQFVCVIVGLSLLLLGVACQEKALYTIGRWFIYGEIFLAFLSVFRSAVRLAAMAFTPPQ